MAIEFARTHIIGRSSGHCAVKAAAYRSGSDMYDAALGKTVHYAHRGDQVVHSAILLPAGADASLMDRETLWTQAEWAENGHSQRARAQLAKDHIVALPVELTLEQQIDLATSFAQDQFVSRGVAVDLNIHQHSEGNPHAHLMVTTRFVGPGGFGAKARELNGNFVGGKRIADEVQLRHWWAAHQNAWAQKNGVDLLVTNNNGEWAAEVHRGPTRHMDQATERGMEADMAVADRQALLIKDPTPLLMRLSDKKAVFNQQDLLIELSSHLPDHTHLAAAHHNALKSAALVPIGNPDANGAQWFTTHQALDQELHLLAIGERLNLSESRFGMTADAVDRVIDKSFRFLSGEQRDAVQHLCADSRRLGVVVGLAGAGKSTMLQAARMVWEARGHRVVGLALAGKAAQGLEESAGINSRTIHSFLKALDRGSVALQSSDVIVLDEAGMVNTSLMLRLAERVDNAGAKLVLVGDPEQLQPIQAGNPLRSFGERFGLVEMAGVRRQSADWQRRATVDLARGRVGHALQAYREHGAMRSSPTRAEAVQAMITDTAVEMAACIKSQDQDAGSLAVLAQANEDVQAINSGIRDHLVREGVITMGHAFSATRTISARYDRTVASFASGDTVLFGLEAAEGVSAGQTGRVVAIGEAAVTVALANGQSVQVSPDVIEPVRQFAPAPDGQGDTAEQHRVYFSRGDRVLFGRNDAHLGVKNGTLGTVLASARNKMDVRLDSGQTVRVDATHYDAISHGYAMTVHKAQGVTVDQSRVLVTRGWDKHLAYVGLSRHREGVKIYFGDNSFKRDSMDKVLSETRRQENILDFAASRGLMVEGGQFYMQPGATLPEYGADNAAHFDQQARQGGEDYLLPEREQMQAFALEATRDNVVFDLAQSHTDPVSWDPDSVLDGRLTDTEARLLTGLMSGASRLTVIHGNAQRQEQVLTLAASVFEQTDHHVIGLAATADDAAALEARTGIPSHRISTWLARASTISAGDMLIVRGGEAIGAFDLIRTLFHAHRHGAQVVLVPDARSPAAPGSIIATVVQRIGLFDLGKGEQPAQMARDEARARLVARMAAAGLDLRDGRVHIIPDSELEQRAKRAEMMLREAAAQKVAIASQPLEAKRRDLQQAYDQAQQSLNNHQKKKPAGIRTSGRMQRWVDRNAQLTEEKMAAGGRLSTFEETLKGSSSPLNEIRREAIGIARQENPDAAAVSDAWKNRSARRQSSQENRWAQERIMRREHGIGRTR